MSNVTGHWFLLDDIRSQVLIDLILNGTYVLRHLCQVCKKSIIAGLFWILGGPKHSYELLQLLSQLRIVLEVAHPFIQKIDQLLCSLNQRWKVTFIVLLLFTCLLLVLLSVDYQLLLLNLTNRWLLHALGPAALVSRCLLELRLFCRSNLFWLWFRCLSYLWHFFNFNNLN